MGKSDNGNGRINLSIIPEHYTLEYTNIDLENFTFSGQCQIRCNVVKATNSIQLNALDIQIVSATLAKDGTTDSMSATSFRYHKRNQTVDIGFDAEMELSDSSYLLSMDFIGVLNDQMCGLYRSKYTNIKGEAKIMATTQFEATDARRAFPCADEPALKATFSLGVTIPGHLQCVSNTPIATSYSKLVGSQVMKTIKFQKTPKMSTYLLAVVIGEFDSISTTLDQIVTTVYTAPGKAPQAQFCLETASRCLALYQKLFQVPYPLTKSDLLAISDFSAGAMENWGCVTYREAKILVKAGVTSETTKRGIARTVCHELAHQWFGNLVTMEYWTQLYLKEGMARFMEFVGIDALFPEWDAWTEFVQSVYGLAMDLDAMKSSHPIEVEVNHPDEISEIFDSISYAKGASVIRMIAMYIGMEAFLEGMRVYLTRHAYGNTVTEDLWKALEEVSGKPVVEIMAPWTLEMGYPVLVLSDNGSFSVERYLATGPDPSAPAVAWPIPVTAVVEGIEGIQGPWVINGPDVDETESLGVKIRQWSSQSKWFKLNVNQTGFFRVAYTKSQFDRLSKIMAPGSVGQLSVADRLGLISDSFAAGKAGYSPFVNSLLLIKEFGKHEMADYAVWQELSDNLSGLALLVRSEPFFPQVQEFIRGIYSQQHAILGWEAQDNDMGRTGTLRAIVIRMLGLAGDPSVIQTAFDRCNAYCSDPRASPIDGDLRLVIFRCALRKDETITFNALRGLYESSTFPEEQKDCLSVMGCVTDSSLRSFMLDYIFDSGKVRYQDLAYPLGSLARSSDEGGRLVWEHFQQNFKTLHTRFGSGPMWAACVALSCAGLSSAKEADDVERFYDDPAHPVGSGARRLATVLEHIRTKAARRERDRVSLGEFFGT